MSRLKIDLAAQVSDVLFKPARYKVLHGGRGGAKSWGIARGLIATAATRKVRILCAREFQTSIADSVHKLLKDQIEALGLLPWFTITKTGIVCDLTGSEFLFKGLRHNAQEIKSTEGIDIAWVEEAQSVSDESWQLLIPTIRKQGSEIWISFNPGEETDATYQRFVVNPPPGALVRKISWSDNPWFPETLDLERRHMLATDPEVYEHVWGGNPRQLSDAVIFRGKVSVETFDTPDNVRFYHGADWGFATDPTALVRCYMVNRTLYVDQEAGGHGIELDHLADRVFSRIPTAKSWPVKADGSRPETISHVARRGYPVSAADKWPGSVEDGIEYLRSFDKIVVHERCVNTAQEFRLYSYKVDRITGDILPVIVDKHNHYIDALRYSLDGYIKRRGFKTEALRI